VYLRGETAHLEFNDGTGSMKNASYWLLGNRGRGTADELFLDVGETTRGTRVNYTTCDPEAGGMDLESNFWSISASSITLNHEADRGSARNVVLRVKDIPVFYTPYLSFPLSKKRKTGFLTPGFGSSNNRGFEVRTPWYWNISPNMDATITPRVLGNSGVMAMGEYRYLFSRGFGQVNLEYLPSDNEFDDRDRSRVQFLHEQTFGSTGRLYAVFDDVCDKQYLEDFGNSLNTSSTRYLDRRADVWYSGSGWSFFGRVQNYETVDPSIPASSRPYSRLPMVRLNWLPVRGLNRMNLQILNDFSYFVRDDQEGFADVEGARVNVYAALSYPMETQATFLTPKLALRATQYSLEEPGPFKSSPSRIIPVASVDSGVYLERDFTIGDTDYLQTLEPRLYYLYVPDDDQDDLPVFDTGIYTDSFATLFREDRFSGVDRVGDANQFALSVTSRFMDRTDGSQLGHVRAGQIYYLADQDVIRQVLTADGLVGSGTPRDAGVGPLLAEFSARVARYWNVMGEIHWEPEGNITEKLAFGLRYWPEDGRVVNLAYRVRRAPSGEMRRNPVDIEQTDVSVRWPFSERWSVVGRWNYAVPEEKSLEVFGGIEYDGCCWAMRAVARRFLNTLDGDYSNGIFLQLELKGLAGIGRGTVDFLEQRIPGYETDF
jgi:LPS-assembly protein